MKFLLCAICMIVSTITFNSFKTNPRWQEQYLKGLTEKEVIQFLGMPDEVDSLKGYMNWFDYRNYKILKVMFMPRLPKNYKQMNEEERITFCADYTNHIFIVHSIKIKNFQFDILLKTNREKKLLKFLKNKEKNYSTWE